MTSRILVAGVAVGCVVAAGVGGFLAVRAVKDPGQLASLGPAETTVEAASPHPVPTTPPETIPVATQAALLPQARPARSMARTTPPVAHAPIAAAPVVETPPSAPEAAPVLSAPVLDGVALPSRSGPTVALEEPAVLLVELPANAVIGVRLDTTVSTSSAHVEDPVEARVTRPVVIDGMTVVPTGAKLRGHVTLVEQGGRFRERARIAIRFTSVTVDDDSYVPIVTEAILREGDAPTGEATAKIGASAVVGSILGGVFGGRKGAAIGAATGAAGGTAMVASGNRSEATIPSGSPFTVRLSEPATFELPR